MVCHLYWIYWVNGLNSDAVSIWTMYITAFPNLSRQAMYIWHKNEARSCNCCCSGRAIIVIYFKLCVCYFRYPTCNMLAPYSYCAPSCFLYFSTLSHKVHNLKMKLLNIKCVFWFSLPLWSMIWSKRFIVLHVQYPLCLSYVNEVWIFMTDFKKILKYQISWKSIQC